jgi:simple sugar transport system ATP-binding protein
LISEDLDELFKLSDRIIVLYEGQIVKEFAIEEADIENVGLAMAGLNE